MNTVVIAGSGQAGVCAAKKLKSLSPETRILIFDTETRGLYAKIRMPELIAGKLPEEKLILSDAQSLEKLGIETHFNEKLVSLNTAEKTVFSSAGALYSYDTLVLATGANAALPRVEGLDTAQRVKTLRRLNDAEDIIALAETSETAIVMGGGLLGLEAAWALKSRGLEVTVVEYMERLLPRQLTSVQSLELLRRFEAMGYSVFLSASARRVANTESGKVSIELADGRTLESDMLVVSAGIVPEISLGLGGGIECGRGIKVDSSLRTNVADVFAVGDCAEACGRVAGLWMAAKDQGEAVAEIIACVRKEYVFPSYSPRLKVAGIDFKEIELIK